MVRSKLTLEPIIALRLGASHNARVRYEHVELTSAPLEDLLRALAYRVEGIVVHLNDLNLSRLQDIRESVLCLFGAAGGAVDGRACGGKRLCGKHADAAGAARDQHDLVGQLAFETLVMDDLQGGWPGIAGALGVDMGVAVAGHDGYTPEIEFQELKRSFIGLMRTARGTVWLKAWGKASQNPHAKLYVLCMSVDGRRSNSLAICTLASPQKQPARTIVSHEIDLAQN